MSKKIALFISHIYGEYQRNLSQGIVDKALEYGYQTEIYTSNDGEDLGHLTETEKCILRLPVYSGLSGIIYASGTYSSPVFRSSVCEALKSSGIPVIEVNDTDPTFPDVTMDNNTMFSVLTEHFIGMHGAKRICYLGCKNEKSISDLRLRIIGDTMERNGLAFDEALDFYDCDETPEEYAAALSFFTKDPGKKPDAILCYNDRLAYRLVITAENAGFKIPEDFGVSGCDHSLAGQNMIPPLTTISYPVYDLGQLAVENLYQLIKGRTPVNTSVFAKVIYGGSCGCSFGMDKKVHLHSYALQNQIAELEKSIITTAGTASAFHNVDDIEDSLDIIADSVKNIRDCTGFYLVLSSGWNNLSDRIKTLTAASDAEGEEEDEGDSMTLYLAVQNGKRLPASTFKNTELLPDFLMSEDGENARIVSPIYHHGSSYGYVVLTFENDRIQYPFHLIQYLVNLSQLLKNLRIKKRSQAMATHLEEIYMKDSLTGLYNKAGFDYYKEKLLDRSEPGSFLSVLFVDMNGLKKINDEFGHDSGDFSIKVLGQAISQALDTEASLAGRIGGDEFNIILRGGEEEAEALKKKITSYLTNYGKLNPGKFAITASIGVSTAKLTSAFALSDLIREADAKMYEEKKNRRS